MKRIKFLTVLFFISALVLFSIQAPYAGDDNSEKEPKISVPNPSFSLDSNIQIQQKNIPMSKGREGKVTVINKKIPVKTYKKNGFAIWEASIPGNRALATPAVVNGRVFIGGGFGSYEFYALDADNGKSKWQIKVNDDGPTAAVVRDGYVVFNTESCTLFVVKAKTGKMVWSRWLGDPLMSQPAISEDKIYMVYPDSKGHILTSLGLKDGKEFWKKRIDGDVISAPVISGDSVYVSTFRGTVYRFGKDDGEERWKKEMNATSAPWIVGDEVFVTKRKPGDKTAKYKPREGIQKINVKGGENINKELWSERDAEYLSQNVQSKSKYYTEQKSDDASVGFSVAPEFAKTQDAARNIGQSTVRGLWEYQGSRNVIVGDKVYNSMGDVLQEVDRKTGKVNWELKLTGEKNLGGHLITPAAIGGSKMVVGTSTGLVICFNRNSGKKLWEVNVGAPIRFQPSLAKGKVYVGTTTGKLICIDTKDKELDNWVMWGGGPEHNGPK